MKRKIIEKWYKRLGFPEKYDAEFEFILKNVTIDAERRENWDYANRTPEENILAYLYFCEELEEKYKSCGISEEILLDTLSDIVIWTNTHFTLTGKFGLSETEWLARHLSFRLFKLGRLQFCMADSEFDIEEAGLKKDGPVMEIHIPEGEPMPLDRCKASIEASRTFFAKYFPDFNYSVYTCHSWLLDGEVAVLAGEASNITAFRGLFKITRNDPSDALLKYIFRWNATREALPSLEAKSSLAKKVKEAALSGARFYESLGYIMK